MKSFLVVNQLNNPFYIDYDNEFANFVIQKCKEKGMIEESVETTELDATLVMQLFSPMVLSQRLLIDQTRQPCSSITCQNGFRFVFNNVDDLLFIAINGDDSESEEFLHRKIQVFIRFMRFLFGSVSEEIGNSKLVTKKAKWAFLRHLMYTWSEMIESEQTFLVEALEKLNVNQMVSEKCMEILEKSVRQIQSVQDYPIQHAVLLVNSRLLALYSKRIAHELRAKDILSLMILSKTLYPDLDGEKYSRNSGSGLNHDDNSDGAEEEYHSAPATPKISNRSSAHSEKHDETFPRSDVLRESVNQKKDGRDTQWPPEPEKNLRSNSSSDDTSFDKECLPESDKSLLEMYNERYQKHDSEEKKNVLENHQCRSLPVSQIVYADVHNNAGESLAQSSETSENAYVPGQGLITSQQDKENLGHYSEHKKRSPPQSEAGESVHVPQGATTLGRTVADGHVVENETVDPSNLPSDRVVESNFDQDVLSLVSRSSSVLSNPVDQTYPELLPCGESTFDISAKDSLDSSVLPPTFSWQIPPRESPMPPRKRRSELSKSYTYAELERSVSNKSIVKSINSAGSYLPQTVFLETSTCLFSPHYVHTAQVLQGVTLVFLSQAPNHALADSIYQIMHNLQDLIQGRRSKLPRSRSLHVYEVVNTLIGKLHSNLRKSKGRESVLIYDVHSRWDKEEIKIRLLEYLEKDSDCSIPPELESPLWEIYKKLRELFSLLFLRPPPEHPHLKDIISRLNDEFSKELLDYKEYLDVKSQRNITMTSYIDEFPGLIHFIFIDRRLHQMTTPSLNVIHEHRGKADATAYIKNNIWRMYQHMMKKLMEGYTTVIMKDGDFYFSYFLWFEDSKKKPLPVHELFKPSNRLPYPGILSGTFYRDIIQQCFPNALHASVYCYEMFLMHLGNVHPQYIASHCRKLALKMWEMSGDAYSPLNLL